MAGAPEPDEGPGEAAEAGWLRVTRTCRVALSELTWRFSTSGGPGGQHANRNQTAAEVSFDVAGSRSLGPRQRARLLERLGAEVRASAADERSQLRNRELALERLRRRLNGALTVPRSRTATRPSRAAQARRVEAKKHRGEIKRDRRRPAAED